METSGNTVTSTEMGDGDSDDEQMDDGEDEQEVQGT